LSVQEIAKYGPEDYQTFPRLYVEGVEAREYMVADLETLTYKLTGRPEGSGVILGKAIYEDAWDLVLDPVEGVAKRSFAVVLPWRNFEALYVAEGTKLLLLEAYGVQVNFVAKEGDKVRERDVVAYILTGKGETRTLRAEAEGVITLIAWQKGTHPPRYAIAIADTADVAILRKI
jgi:hypothetical protein